MKSGCCMSTTQRSVIDWLGTVQTGRVKPKNDLHPTKIMLSVWWSVRGITHWELLPNGCNITADLFCQQLDRVTQTSRESRMDFILCMIMPDFMLHNQHAKSYWSWDKLRFHIHHILLTWLLQTTTCIVFYLTICVKKNSTMETTWKWIWLSFLDRSPRTSTNAGFFPFQSVGDKS